MLNFQPLGGSLKRSQVLFLIVFLSGALESSFARAQQPVALAQAWQEPQDPASPNPEATTPAPQDPPQPKAAPDPKGDADKKSPIIESPKPKIEPEGPEEEGVQTKRILWIIPNYRSVSANTYLPPQSFKDKFWMATQDSFDYSAFIYAGIFAGTGMAGKSEPDFGQGAAGYGNYFAHTFADDTVENYMVEAVVPTLTKEDPRYYTLGHGGFFKRSGYALSRLLVTRTDSAKRTVNLSEIVGAGAASGIGNLYYPSNQNQLVKTYQRWISQILQDGVGNLAKEFWPDVNRALFHNKY